VECDVEWEAFERLEHGITGVRQVIADFWPLVEASTERDCAFIQIVNVRGKIFRGAVYVASSERLCVFSH
jgi:hypothetical protein